MFDAFINGLLLVFHWQTLGFLFVGIFTGIWLGAVPGLGGISGLAIMIPFTFGMRPVDALSMLLGMLAVVNASDSIPAVMMGVPGTAAAQALILDGYPLAKSGQATRAYGAAFSASAIGGVFGAFALAFCLPLIMPIILSFTSAEFFALGVLGLTMVGSLSGNSILKGMAAACFGLLLSTVGYAKSVAIPRYWFGIDYLLDGLPFLPVVLGIFAIPEIIELVVSNSSISQVPLEQSKGGGIFRGIRDTFEHWGLTLRCAALGAYIGLLPGLGGVISDWAAYSHAVQSAKDKSQFGRGDIRGVIGPEAAKNATLGGSLIPTIAFGIPGSVPMAIMMSAFMIQGLKPGPEMLTSHLTLTFNMVWTVAIASVFVALFLMIWSRQIAKVAFLPGHVIVPGIMFFIFMGAWMATSAIGDWISLIAFGIIGSLMKRGGWPRPPVILGVILGDIMENALSITLRVHNGWDWLFRPLVLVIFGMAAIAVAYAAINMRRDRKRAESDRAGGEGTGGHPAVSLGIAMALIALFSAAIILAAPWMPSIRLFPLMAAIPGLLFTVILVVLDGPRILGIRGAVDRSRAGLLMMSWTESLRITQFLGYLITATAVTLVIGQKLALPLFCFVYLVRWGRYRWSFALLYAVAAWLVLILFYDKILHIIWCSSLIGNALEGHFPASFPVWLLF